MKKLFLLAATAALILTSCAKIDNLRYDIEDQLSPVDFGVYVTQTKAGKTGEMVTDSLKKSGFGVFASQTTGNYNNASDKMNFMYNQAVTWDTDHWTYSPVKYWPNQIQAGNTDSQSPNAQATAAHKVSFFAYAPYVETASGDFGITAITANSATGDPKVTYTVSNDLDKQVDLVWGVSHGATWTNVAGGTNTPTLGLPYLNLQKPAIGTAIRFYFKHALSQLTLTAQAAYNQTTAGGTAQNGVKITISQVQVTVPGMYTSAALNLNNQDANTPLWESAAGSADLSLTISGSNVNTTVKDLGDEDAADQPTGVTGSKTNVIKDGKYYTIIPKAGSVTVTVKVTYYVTTDDTKLADGHSRVENVIQQTVTFPSGFAAGTKNSINMILGISEVKLEAEVDPWTTGSDVDINLPLNVSGS